MTRTATPTPSLARTTPARHPSPAPRASTTSCWPATPQPPPQRRHLPVGLRRPHRQSRRPRLLRRPPRPRSDSSPGSASARQPARRHPPRLPPPPHPLRRTPRLGPPHPSRRLTRTPLGMSRRQSEPDRGVDEVVGRHLGRLQTGLDVL